jgi:3-deoxy-manno-octulosonate cytidylyltransferase (CMP-KDO synthetase)
VTGALCVIPARWASTRLPGKPLRLIGDRPLVRHVWDRATESRAFARVIVATDDARIAAAVRGWGGEAMLTDPRLPSGTDRVAAVARRVRAPLIVNLQGDEPFLAPRAIAALVRAMRADPRCPYGTLARRTPWSAIAAHPHAVKVAVGPDGRARWFSRSPIPFSWTGRDDLLHHLGVYAYRRAFLLRFAALPPADLERRERLEQLRAIVYGVLPRVVVADTPALGVDTERDVRLARAWLIRGDRRRTAGRRGNSRSG